MFLLVRALFWLAVVSLFVPYKEFDLEKGRFRVDYPALNHQLHALAHPCKTSPDFCEAAGDLAHVAKKELVRLAVSATDYAKERS
jgi:hypothetical protein